MSQLIFENKQTDGVDNDEEVIRILAKEQPEGGYTITVPKIPEIVTQSDTEEGILDQFNDALRELFRSYLQEDEEFPYGNNLLFEIEFIKLD